MAAPWKETPLRYISTEWCDGPFGSGLASEHYRDSGARVVRLQNIRQAEFAGADEAYVDEEYFTTSLARHNVQEGDVLVAGLGDVGCCRFGGHRPKLLELARTVSD